MSCALVPWLCTTTRFAKECLSCQACVEGCVSAGPITHVAAHTMALLCCGAGTIASGPRFRHMSTPGHVGRSAKHKRTSSSRRSRPVASNGFFTSLKVACVTLRYDQSVVWFPQWLASAPHRYVPKLGPYVRIDTDVGAVIGPIVMRGFLSLQHVQTVLEATDGPVKR